jgi:signal peptidase I
MRLVLRGATWILRAALVSAVIALALSALATRVAPLVGREIFVIRGASMAPAVPLGAAIVVRPIPAADIVPGDLVTFRGTNGVVVTHRVIDAIVDQGERLFRTKGDANATFDAFLVPEGAVVGTVEVQVPILGYILGMLSQPSGLLSFSSGLIAAYLVLVSLEETVTARNQRPVRARLVHRGTAA